MSYPNYPTYPASTGSSSYPAYPPNIQDYSQINQSFTQSSYQIGGTPAYPPYPSNQPSYPNYPSHPDAPNSYPPVPATEAFAYPSQTQQPHYPASIPSYPQSHSTVPPGPFMDNAHSPSGPQPSPQRELNYSPTAPFAPPPAANLVNSNQPTVLPQEGFPGSVSSSSGPQPSAPGGFYPPSTTPHALPPSETKPSATGGLYPSAMLEVPAVATILQPKTEENIPTVYPASSFDVRDDANKLQKAMKGLGTDEKALINVLCYRTRSQRTAINHSFKLAFSKDLEPKLKSELSGSFLKVMVALCLPMEEYMAREMNKALIGKGSNEEIVLEILCSGTNKEIREMSATYKRLYGHQLEDDFKEGPSSQFKNLLILLSKGQRDEDTTVDIQKVKDDVKNLLEAGVAQKGTNERVFNSVLAIRSWFHLRQVMIEYNTTHGHTLEEAVLKEYSANKQTSLLVILQCAQNRPAYFAQRLHHSMKGMGTKDRNLIRIMVTRCDIDLGNIKREYEKKFNRSLQADISSDTSGDYKKALLALLG